MSIEAMALVLHHSRATGTDKLILLGIANHAGDGGAWPTVETLSRYGGVTERQVQKCIRKLEALGEVRVDRQAGGDAHLADWRRPNRYEVLVACPATCDHTANHRPIRLPQAPAHLWIDGVSPVTPGVLHDTRGVSSTTPGGVSSTTPKPSIEPTHLTVVTETTDRARPPTAKMPDCDVCSLTHAECMRRPLSGHDYTPRAVDHHRRIETIREEYRP